MKKSALKVILAVAAVAMLVAGMCGISAAVPEAAESLCILDFIRVSC